MHEAALVCVILATDCLDDRSMLKDSAVTGCEEPIYVSSGLELLRYVELLQRGTHDTIGVR